MKTKQLISNGKKIIWEMVPVILGIWIALWVSNWNENKRDRQFLERIMQSVQSENKVNLEEISVIRPRQEKLMENVENHLNDNGTTILQILSKSGGFKIPAIKNASWKALTGSKIELMDYKTLKILSDIEEGQKAFESKIDYATSFLYQNLNATGEDEKTIFKVLLNDIIDSENQLEKLFRELEGIDSQQTGN
ncbi:hypothetical protein [Flagellimonas meridianipacifica]|uniref:Uncharacterized protein n=1 Tax=Flagellimonas meridianipacifica TaxID=1080225 RepID=A0A2T0M9V5_9FLAO|nr:hypothetical protein [Allomuricauda pacifica]PRX54258.1 hypothetical protein CLV81_2656 [Allomuricauda pacifica]